MIRLLVGLTIILLAVGVYLWLRKKPSKKRNSKLEKVLGGSDYQRLKVITPLKCLECGECAVDSKGCCSNCVNSGVKSTESTSIEIHCQEHNHDHQHHYHSSPGGEKVLLGLFLTPLIGGIIAYRIIIKI